MRKYIFVLISVIFIFFIINCDLYRTYSKSEFLSIGTSSNNNINAVYVKELTHFNYDIINGDTYDFDNIEALDRDQIVNFVLINNSKKDLVIYDFNNKYIYADNTNDFTVSDDDIKAQNKILPGESKNFTIRFTSDRTDDNLTDSKIIIKNNIIPDFYFNVKCTTKEEAVYKQEEIGDGSWDCPVIGRAEVLLVGGGGGGGAGCNGDAGGGGGGAGEIFFDDEFVLSKKSYLMYVGKGGRGGRDGDDSNPGESGINGEASSISDESGVIESADYGRGGGRAPLYSPGIGGAGGNNDPELRGENGYNGQGGSGGDNGNGHGGSGWGRSGANDGRAGGTAPVNSGGGGGGGGAAITDGTKHGGDGGSGGSGYIQIYIKGFVKE